MEARFTCGSIVFFIFFTKKFTQSHLFVKKDVQFRPAGGDMSFWVWDGVTFVKRRTACCAPPHVIRMQPYW
jgi:hypothetical protein